MGQEWGTNGTVVTLENVLVLREKQNEAFKDKYHDGDRSLWCRMMS